jgi:hypothetical protein
MWVSTPLDAPLQVSADGAAEPATAFEHGTKAHLAFAQDADGRPLAGAFDISISVAVEQVNYGVSPAIRSSEALCLGRPWTAPPGPF